MAKLGVPAKAQRSGFGGERRSKGVNEAFRPKGGNGVHGLCDDETEGLMQRSWRCSANSDYSMSENRTAHNRILHSASKCAGTIPQTRRRKVRELRFRLWGEKLRSLPFSSFPHRTHFVGLRRGPRWGGGVRKDTGGIVPGIN